MLLGPLWHNQIRYLAHLAVSERRQIATPSAQTISTPSAIYEHDMNVSGKRPCRVLVQELCKIGPAWRYMFQIFLIAASRSAQERQVQAACGHMRAPAGMSSAMCMASGCDQVLRDLVCCQRACRLQRNRCCTSHCMRTETVTLLLVSTWIVHAHHTPNQISLTSAPCKDGGQEEISGVHTCGSVQKLHLCCTDKDQKTRSPHQPKSGSMLNCQYFAP